ncbi:MAG: hypothetical protein ACI9ME_002124, partial [Ilumatobacter sp.]
MDPSVIVVWRWDPRVVSRRDSGAGSTLRAMFINGEWVEATSGKRFEVTNPATGEVID